MYCVQQLIYLGLMFFNEAELLQGGAGNTMSRLSSYVRAVIRPPALAVARVGRLVRVWSSRFRLWLYCNGVGTPFDITARLEGSDVILEWFGDSTNVGVYVVERADNGAPYQIKVWVGAGALPGVHWFSWADTNIDLSGTYCYRITAQHSNGSRGCPAEPVCIAGCNGVKTPFDVVGIAWGAGENRLRWKCDVTHVAQFRIERGVGGPYNYQQHATVPVGSQSGEQEFSYSDFSVEGGVLYCYRIASEQSGSTLGCFTDPICAGSQWF